MADNFIADQEAEFYEELSKHMGSVAWPPTDETPEKGDLTVVEAETAYAPSIYLSFPSDTEIEPVLQTILILRTYNSTKNRALTVTFEAPENEEE